MMNMLMILSSGTTASTMATTLSSGNISIAQAKGKGKGKGKSPYQSWYGNDWRSNSQPPQSWHYAQVVGDSQPWQSPPEADFFATTYYQHTDDTDDWTYDTSQSPGGDWSEWNQ